MLCLALPINEQGVKSELNVRGYMRATLSPASNKMLSAELFFDTGIVNLYLSTIVQHEQVRPSMSGTSISNSFTDVNISTQAHKHTRGNIEVPWRAASRNRQLLCAAVRNPDHRGVRAHIL